MKTAVAFLQNMWVRDPAAVQAQIELHGEAYRLRFMAHALFAGCVTGRRLRLAFGTELIEQILWEETTREIADNPRTVYPAQKEHIRTVLETYKPMVVLTFGRIAEESVRPLWNGELIVSPHPCARVQDTAGKLKSAAMRLRTLLSTPPLPNTETAQRRKFKVSGICLVPHEACVEVEANNAAEAESLAGASYRQGIEQRGDLASAYDFRVMEVK